MTLELLNGRYRLQAPPAGDGQTLTAHDTLFDREVVVELLPALDDGEQGWDSLSARVHHPNLASVIDHGLVARGPVDLLRRRFLVRDRLDGLTLRVRLDQGSPLSPGDGGRLALDLLAALETAHAAGCHHHRLDPEAIVLRDDGDAVLLGLGLSERPVDPASPYRAPELRRGTRGDERSDLYSLGACLYEALSGRPPDPESPIPLRALRPEVPPELERAVGQLLLNEPRARAESTAAASASFAEALGGGRVVGLLGGVEPRFVGRQDAMEAIEVTLDEAQALAAVGRAAREEGGQGGPTLLLLSGREGVGKSRLLTEAARRLALRGATVLSSRAFEGGDPYACWRELLLRAPSSEPCRVALNALAPSSPLPAPARHEFTARALIELARERPLALLIDDADLLTEPALELLLHVSRAAAAPHTGGAVAIVLSAGPASTQSPLRRTLARPLAPPHAQHDLHELAPAEAENLVASVVVDPEETKRLVSLGGGNPFLLSELAREHRQGGGTPASAEELVGQRLAQVGAPARSLLDALSVVGRPLDEPALRALTGTPTSDPLRQLAALGLLRAEGDAWSLRHGVTRALVLQELDAEQQRDLCRRALDALQDAPLGERARLALLAQSARAVELALAAAPNDAAPEELYEAVLGLLPAGLERAGVQQRLAEHRRRRGELPEARRALESALEDLGDSAQPKHLAPIHLALGQVASEEGDTNEALEWAARGRRALEGAHSRDSDEVLARLYALEARVATIRSDYPAAVHLLQRAKEVAGSAEPTLLARLQVEEGNALTLSLDRTRYAEAGQQLESACAIYREAGDVAGEIDALRSLGNFAYYSGDVAGAEARYRRALELCEAQADLTLAAGLWNNLGLVLRDSGELRGAEAALERALGLAERIGQGAVACRALTNVGRVRRALGDLRGAERSYHQAAELALRVGEPVIASAAFSELGHARLEGGRYRAALSSYKRSRRLRLKLGDPGRVAESELELAELWRSAGDVRAALGSTVRALALQAAMGDADGAALAMEGLEFVVGRPGGPAALLALVRRPVHPAGPPPVKAGMRRGRLLGRLARRSLAAALTGRAGDAEQSRAHARLARRTAEAVSRSDLAPGIKALAESLALEADAVTLASAADLRGAHQRIEAALGALGDASRVRRGALLLKRAFLDLALGDPAAAIAAATSDADPSLTRPLAERRGVGRALIMSHARRRGAEVPRDLPVETPGLAACEEIARRLGDVALAALVATARADEATLEDDLRDAGRERTSARIAAERLASGLPGSLREGLIEASAPAGQTRLAPTGPSATSGDLLSALAERLLAGAGVDLEPLLTATLQTLIQATGAERGLVALGLGDAEPQPHCMVGLEPGDLPTHLGRALTHVWRQGQSLLIPDTRSDPRLGQDVPARGEASLLALPIGQGGSKLGVLVLDAAQGRLDHRARSTALDLVAHLGAPLARALQRAERMGELSRLAEAYRETTHEPSDATQAIVGRSPALRVVLRLIERYGRTSAPVTIHGESGTGKELVARALHQSSPRRRGPFITLNCSAVSESLLESELFGVTKGAFTGADRDRQGLFELAHEGSLFLDEVADMSLEMQSKLLRVLETGELRPVGARQILKVDVRIISASHSDLRQCVAEGSFREDLFYRLNVLRLELPPLRSRREDIPLLCEHFLASAGEGKLKQLTPAAMEALLRHPFPGNVRELRNVLERACVLEPGSAIGPDRLLLETPQASSESDTTSPAYHKTFQYQGVALNRRQRQVLDHLATGVAAITNREYCQLAGVSERTGLRDLTHLVTSGLLERLGKRKGARYRLRREEPDEAS
jgi:transcriptional regulator with GAF, ATPase, and Fis domain/serine/threonine protein kinase/tetratricopeptide (TPR) repeat protein